MEDLRFVELVYGILFNPKVTFSKIAPEPPLFLSFCILMLVVVLTATVNILIPNELENLPTTYAAILSKVGPFLGIIGAIITIVFWFVRAGILQLVAELLGGKGRATGVLAVLALAEIPKVMAIPFQVISYFTTSSFISKFIMIFAALAVFIWSIVILVIGFREVQQLSTGRTILALVLPAVAFVLLLMVFAISLVAIVAPLAGAVQ